MSLSSACLCPLQTGIPWSFIVVAWSLQNGHVSIFASPYRFGIRIGIKLIHRLKMFGKRMLHRKVKVAIKLANSIFWIFLVDRGKTLKLLEKFDQNRYSQKNIVAKLKKSSDRDIKLHAQTFASQESVTSWRGCQQSHPTWKNLLGDNPSEARTFQYRRKMVKWS